MIGIAGGTNEARKITVAAGEGDMEAKMRDTGRNGNDESSGGSCSKPRNWEG